MQRVVLILSAQHLYGSFQFVFPSYQRVVRLQAVVQAGDVVPPRFALLLRGDGIVVFIDILYVFVLRDEFADKFRHELDVFLQEIGRPGVFQLDHPLRQMRHVQCVAGFVVHDDVGMLEELVHLYRDFQFVLHVLRKAFYFFLEVFVQRMFQKVDDAVVLFQGIDEGYLFCQCPQQMFGHEELVPVG